MRILFLFVSCLMSTLSVTAQAILWNGGNGNWNVPANWDCVCVPRSAPSIPWP
ncbi:MAG: hypothetical protein IPN60_10845 [Saprospiraceae bacterium]|nr:hypothetical protein [Candidatus Opimibacter skivensis]HQW03472.1 hypothetical protein [Saprospiraceae bacterium]HQW27320.1 hypothetical protein [Saprospiraceae bacterium]